MLDQLQSYSGTCRFPAPILYAKLPGRVFAHGLKVGLWISLYPHASQGISVCVDTHLPVKREQIPGAAWRLEQVITILHSESGA